MNSSLPEAANILPLILANAELYPQRAALKRGSVSISYRALRVMVLSVAAHLRERGAMRGETIGLDIANPLYAIVTALACGALGCAFVHATGEVLASPAAGVRILLTDRARPVAGGTVLLIEPSWLRLPESARIAGALLLEGFASSADRFMVALSSGTTGHMKMMAISAGNAMSRSDPAHLLDRSAVPVVASFFHPLHQGNMWNVLRVLRAGGTFLFSGRLGSWVKDGVTYVIGSPAQFLAERDVILAQTRPIVRHAWIGGGPVYATQLRDLLRMFRTVHVTYGASECGIASSRAVTLESWRDGAVSLGVPAEGCAVEVVGEEGQQRIGGSTGLVRLRTPWMVGGYLGDGAATAAFFQNGWFYTGDTGYIDVGGELVVTGRVAESLNLGGSKINPSDVDEILIGHPEVRDAISFAERTDGGHDVLSAVLHLEEGSDAETCIEEASAQIVTRLGRSRVPVRFYLSGIMPRNENGKAMRREAASMTGSFARMR